MRHDTDASTTQNAQTPNSYPSRSSDGTSVSESYQVPLPESEVRDLLRNDRRCHALRALADAEDGTTSQRELAELVAARETRSDRPTPASQRGAVEGCLSAATLPALEEAGAITRGAGRDPDGARTVELTETGEALAALLETIATRTGGDA